MIRALLLWGSGRLGFTVDRGNFVAVAAVNRMPGIELDSILSLDLAARCLPPRGGGGGTTPEISPIPVRRR